MSDKPTAAFGLSLLCGLFVFLGGLLYIALGSFASNLLTTMNLDLGGISRDFLVLTGAIGIVWAAAIVACAFMINTGDPSRVKLGSILVIAFSIFSWFGSAGGIFIGFFLGLVGGIAGLLWKPKNAIQSTATSGIA